MEVRRAAGLLALSLAFSAGSAGEIVADAVDAAPRPPAVEERIDEIRRRVQAATVYPTVAERQGLTGVTRVQFQIGGDGRAVDILVVESSGHGILDRAAERGVVDAGRLPFVHGRLRVPVRFGLKRR